MKPFQGDRRVACGSQPNVFPPHHHCADLWCRFLDIRGRPGGLPFRPSTKTVLPRRGPHVVGSLRVALHPRSVHRDLGWSGITHKCTCAAHNVLAAKFVTVEDSLSKPLRHLHLRDDCLAEGGKRVPIFDPIKHRFSDSCDIKSASMIVTSSKPNSG